MQALIDTLYKEFLSNTPFYYLIIILLSVLFGSFNKFILPRINFWIIKLYDRVDKRVDFEDTIVKDPTGSSKTAHSVDYWEGKVNAFRYIEGELESSLKGVKDNRIRSRKYTTIFRKMFRASNHNLKLSIKQFLSLPEVKSIGTQIRFEVGKNSYEENLTLENYEDFFLKNSGKRNTKLPQYYKVYLSADEPGAQMHKVVESIQEEDSGLERQIGILRNLNRVNALVNFSFAVLLLFFHELTQDLLVSKINSGILQLPESFRFLFEELNNLV